ncbi:MAG TPA: hypothetical protein VFF16_03095 [Telluria sp.]|nr:hypothetical protein [Telluria sp.]
MRQLLLLVCGLTAFVAIAAAPGKKNPPKHPTPPPVVANIIEPLRPMAFLAGHCWRGDIPATMMSDEHCFSWVLNGHVMRDTHTVRTPGKPDFVGETTYFWNPAGKTVEYLYLASTGAFSRGVMETTANTLYVPPQGDGANPVPVRSHWAPQGDDAYEAWNEEQGKDGMWNTTWRMTLRKVN